MEGVNFFLIQVIAAVQRLMHHRVNMLARGGEDGLFSELVRRQMTRAQRRLSKTRFLATPQRQAKSTATRITRLADKIFENTSGLRS